MLQDILPHSFDNHWQADLRPQAGDLLFSFSFSDKAVMVREDLSLPRWKNETSLLYLFSIDGVRCWLSPGKADGTYQSLQECRGRMEKTDYFLTCTAWHLYLWYRHNRYCGVCGKEMVHKSDERAMVCPSCRNVVYPKLMPAVIVGVWQDSRLLLTRYSPKHSAFRRHALVAGFVEIGESVEETVRREVKEETGLDVTDIRYYKSQPWGIAGDVLLGYYCKPSKDKEITLEEDELSSAEWVDRSDMAAEGDPYSLTGEMMTYFRDHPEAFQG